MTGRERDTYRVIRKFIEKNGYSPSIREICDLMGLASPCSVWVKLKSLREKGYIDYIDNKNRTIRIVKYDDKI